MAQNWAIAIGINQYEHLSQSSHLRYAVRDAELMRDFLCQTASFPEKNVLLCSDESRPIGSIFTRPSRSNLRRLLREELQQAHGADNLWFFFAGHGMAGRNGDYFLPIDGNPNDLEDTAVSVDFVTEYLRRCQAKNVVLILDMCRNEGRNDSRDISVSVGKQTIKLARERGMITMFSCSRGERSYEIPELEQGAFTHSLVNGLKQHTILRQLDDYLRREIPGLRQRYAKQIPIPRIIPEPGWKYDAPLLPGYATQSDVGQLIERATQAELDEDFEQARQFWWQVIDAGSQSERSTARNALDRIRRKEMARIQSVPSASPPPSVSPVGRDIGETISPPNPQPEEKTTNPTATDPFRLQDFPFKTARIVSVRKEGGLLGFGGQAVCDIKREGCTAKCFVEPLGNGVTLEMVQIPGGTFMMGSPESEDGYKSERPQHSVTVKPFFIGKFPITQAQYEAVMGNNPVTQYDSDRFVAPDKPVVGVSWNDAIAFCERLSQQTKTEYRLPSEAEWEYACRAGNETPFHFGETITTDLANYRGTDWEYQGTTYPGNYANGPKGEYREEPTPVGSFAANAFGLFDMHGNVWEWCLDHWHENYQDAPTDGNAWIEGGDKSLRLLRGGSWPYDPWDCRSADRVRLNADFRSDDFGFRVVCSVPRSLP
ncbi:MAG: SUMF1/EgtB/PvdO family nonheme iron enzyme [Elainellaceae cyanobacterium]